MPAVRDVGGRFIAPSYRHTVRWAMYTNFDAIHGRPAFRLVHRGRGEKSGLAARAKSTILRFGDCHPRALTHHPAES